MTSSGETPSADVAEQTSPLDELEELDDEEAATAPVADLEANPADVLEQRRVAPRPLGDGTE